MTNNICQLDGQWYFWDDSAEIEYGPFPSYNAALEAWTNDTTIRKGKGVYESVGVFWFWEPDGVRKRGPFLTIEIAERWWKEANEHMAAAQ